MILLWSLLWLGCGSPGETPSFSDRLVPWEAENRAPPVPPIGGDPRPEALSWVSGSGALPSGEEVYWVHARGWVKADLEETWAALQIPEVGVDRREVAEWSLTEDTVPGFDASYTIHNVAKKVITVRYDQVWVHELQAEEERVVAQWDLADHPDVIKILRGSALLLPEEDQLTEIELILHLQAVLRDEQTLERYAQDLFDDLLAAVHNRPFKSF